MQTRLRNSGAYTARLLANLYVVSGLK